MNIFLLLLGILIQIVVIIDIFKTILYINGAGYLSHFASKTIWKLFFWASKENGRSPLLNLCGPIILVFFLFMWISLIWLGVSLMFIADPDSILQGMTGEPATVVGKIYYVGYILTSLGNGDYSAAHGTWQIVSNLMGIHSMIFISLGIAYLIPILQAVIDKRTLSVQIAMLGSNPIEIIKNGYNGKNFSALYHRFETLETLLIKHGERHLAYPILHYFHANDMTYALPLNLAALDEAMIIQKVYQIDDSANSFHWHALKHSLDNFYLRLEPKFLIGTNQPPPFNYEKQLAAIFDNLSLQPSTSELKHLEHHRKKVIGYVKSDGWRWEDVLKENKPE